MPGYAMIARDLLDHPVWTMTHEQRSVFFALVLLVNYEDREAVIGGKRIAVPRGSTLLTQEAIATRAGVSRKVVRRTLAILENLGTVARALVGRRSGHGIWLTTLVNYNHYQESDNYKGHGLGRSGPAAGPLRARSGDTAGHTTKEGKKGRREEGNDLISKSQDQDPLWPVLRLHRALVLSHPRATVVGWKQDASFRKHASKALESYRAIQIDPGLGPDLQCAVLRHAFADQATWGNGVCWADVLSGAAPAAAFLKHAKRLHQNYQNGTGKKPERTAREIFGSAYIGPDDR